MSWSRRRAEAAWPDRAHLAGKRPLPLRGAAASCRALVVATGVLAARAAAARGRLESVAAWTRRRHRLGSRSSGRPVAGARARPRVPVYPLTGAVWLHDRSPAQRRLVVHGLHVVLGAAGTGKTTLVLNDTPLVPPSADALLQAFAGRPAD